LLAEYASAGFTYDEVGATRGPLPPGYHHIRRRERIGDGVAALERAADALRHWRMHERAGLTVAAAGPADEGRTVVLGLGRPVGLVIPCRVIYTIDTERRRGFGYGTLPGHPEIGEEAFVLELGDDGLWFTITAFSRPGDPLVRASGPLGTAAQAYALKRYVRALATYAR
jgi:uncharacterized protein (UPF0548 family)